MESRFIVIECQFANSAPLIAIKADRVHEVTAVTRSQIDDVPDVGMNIEPSLVRCLIKLDGELILMPDINAIFKNLCHAEKANDTFLR